MRPLPPMNALKAFDVASRALNFTQAATELNVTHGAVSRQISMLEEYFHFPLFTRGGRGLTLTEEGVKLAHHVHAAFDGLRAATEQLEAERQSPLSLRVSVPPTLAMWWLMPRMGALENSTTTKLRIELSTSTAAVNFDGNSYDAAIRRISSVPRGMSAHRFMDGRSIPVCSPQFQTLNRLAGPKDLSGATLVITRSEEHAWDHWFRAHKIKRTADAPVMVFDQLYFALEAAIDSLGVALMPAALVENEIRRKRLCALATVREMPALSYALLSPRVTARQEAVEGFGSWLSNATEHTH